MALSFQNKLFQSLLKISERFPGGSAFRGTMVLGYAAPLRKAARLSEEIAEQVNMAEMAYLLFLKHGGEASAALARTEILKLKKVLGSSIVKDAAAANRPLAEAAAEVGAAARRLPFQGSTPEVVEDAHALAILLEQQARKVFTPDDLARAHDKANAWLRVVNTNQEELEKSLGTAVKRRAENHRRSLGRREHTLDFNTALERVEKLMATGAAGVGGSSGERALRLFTQSVSPEDFEDIWQIADRLAIFKQLPLKMEKANHLGGLAALDEQAFRALFRSEANNLKGLLLEKWFWRSQFWREQQKVLWANANAVAAKLGQDYKPILITSPLLESSKEIYDGVIIIARPASDTESGAMVGFLHTVIQIKAERVTSVVRQINRDIARENNFVDITRLVTREDRVAFGILPSPPSFETNRIIVAPSLPASTLAAEAFQPGASGIPRPLRDRGLVQKLENGTDVLAVSTLLSAEQLDDLAYLLIRTVITE